MRFVHIIALILALSVPATGEGQSAEVEIVRVALQHVRKELPAGPFIVGRQSLRVGTRHVLPGLDESDEIASRAMASTIGATAADVDQVRQCAKKDPRTCRLVGANAMVTYPTIFLLSDRAEAYLRIWTYSPEYLRQPVHEQDVRIDLEKDARGWQVLRTEVLRQT